MTMGQARSTSSAEGGSHHRASPSPSSPLPLPPPPCPRSRADLATHAPTRKTMLPMPTRLAYRSESTLLSRLRGSMTTSQKAPMQISRSIQARPAPARLAENTLRTPSCHRSPTATT